MDLFPSQSQLLELWKIHSTAQAHVFGVHDASYRNGETFDALLDDLKRVFLDLGLQDEMEGNVDACYEILNFDLENLTSSVSGNKFDNLPYVMRALDLHEWFFNRIRNGNQHLLGSYAISSPDEDLDYHFRDTLGKIQGKRTPYHTLSKLKFLHDIGFGENRHTMEVLPHLHGTQSELQMRFDCLIRAGIEFSKLCKMISLTTKILNQHPGILEKKVNFLLEDMGLTVLNLDAFPAYLCYNLENRIKPRFEFYLWLTEKGLCMKDYSLGSIIATSDKIS
ncbi:Transcription termination factor, mitochondrial/chloroplastic [Dillenia turbinata]|uniref:Transcription termination factor, mitochondrial/chloroplastic n=1 Tax=Dillenia turbinata TaxID=194707 RepID=A0AAN8UZ32_9MAGN